ncbi:hypothetical protein [Vagococcus sp.]|uniref:hypothetical protein n=1 Tax=Vagococcus sp. TaxID=1933889 RepID=UPI003F9DF5A3
MDKHKRTKNDYLSLGVKLLLALLIYLGMNHIRNVSAYFPYEEVVANVNSSLYYKTIYFIMSFSEGEFYGGVMTTLFLLIGSVVAWLLYRKNSKWQGFPIAQGSGLWPWILASQMLSLFLTIYVFDFTRFFSAEVNWLPVFIVVVGTPPALTLVYGGGWKKLLTISGLSALLTFPFAHWLNNYIIPPLNLPGMVSNVATMAFVGFIVSAICRQLPWMTISQAPIAIERAKAPMKEEDTLSFSWSIRRTFADFSEAWFYGNEWIGLAVLIGVLLDWLLNIEHINNGSGMIPNIVMGQMIASAVGIFLYRHRFTDEGWYPTFMPLVSTVPGVILMAGGGFWFSIIVGVLSGVFSAPVGDYIAKRLPAYVPKAVGFVSGMTIVTIMVSVIMQAFI